MRVGRPAVEEVRPAVEEVRLAAWERGERRQSVEEHRKVAPAVEVSPEINRSPALPCTVRWPDWATVRLTGGWMDRRVAREANSNNRQVCNPERGNRDNRVNPVRRLLRP